MGLSITYVRNMDKFLITSPVLPAVVKYNSYFCL